MTEKKTASFAALFHISLKLPVLVNLGVEFLSLAWVQQKLDIKQKQIK